MAENNAPEVKLNENPEGTVSFATDVVATIAGLAANEVEGVAGMTGASSSLADILTRKNTRNYTRGVKVDIENNMVKVDVTIVVEYGSPVPDVARSIQENVKKAIETMSGLTVHSVDVHVSGISFERDQRAAKELDEQQKKMLERAKAETEAPAAEPEKVQEQPEKEPADDDIDIEEDIDEIEPEDEPEEEPDADSEEE